MGVCTKGSLKINFTHHDLYSIIFLIATKSSNVSMPIGDDLAKATLILILLSNALNCSRLLLISFNDCL